MFVFILDIITNRHVLNYHENQVYNTFDMDDMAIFVRFPQNPQKWYKAYVVILSNNYMDLALIKTYVENVPVKDIKLFCEDDNILETPKVGDEVLAIGYPLFSPNECMDV